MSLVLSFAQTRVTNDQHYCLSNSLRRSFCQKTENQWIFFLTNETARLLAVFVSLMPAWVKEVWLSRLPQSRCARVLMQISPRYLLFWRSVAFSPAIIRISLSLSLRSKVLSPSPTKSNPANACSGTGNTSPWKAAERRFLFPHLVKTNKWQAVFVYRGRRVQVASCTRHYRHTQHFNILAPSLAFSKCITFFSLFSGAWKHTVFIDRCRLLTSSQNRV